jgi:hypothetical protein
MPSLLESRIHLHLVVQRVDWKELVDAGHNGLMASYDGQFEEALAKVKEGAS